jgi:hypothetical protein
MTDAPESLKTHNWTLYEQSMSADPSIACQYIGKYITSLMTTLNVITIPPIEKITKLEIDEITAILNYEILGARRAWKEYNDGQGGRGMQTVTVVLSKVGRFAYDERFAKAQAKAFTGR